MNHFTLTERKTLKDLLQSEAPYRDIAKVLQKALSSISDEINRNGGRNKYNPYKAEARAQRLKQDRVKRTKLEISPGLKAFVINKIKEDWSPEQISAALRLQAKEKCILSTETIYQFIYSEEGKQLKLWTHLRHKKKPQRQSWSERKKYKVRSRIPERQHISLRSPVAELRTEYGHFEADLMIFSHTKKVLAVFVDRHSRQTFAFINPDKTASSMKDTIREFVSIVGIGLVKSITFDNGTENFYHYQVRDEFGTFETFFCDPYCSWQKATVENTNKLLRQYFPRHISDDDLNDNFLSSVLTKLNNRPRKCINFLSPNKLHPFCSV